MIIIINYNNNNNDDNNKTIVIKILNYDSSPVQGLRKYCMNVMWKQSKFKIKKMFLLTLLVELLTA